jgi:predicted ester cyclase
MRQIGYQLLPGFGGEQDLVPGPATEDGVLLIPQKVEESQKSLALVEAMLNGLMSYDRRSISSMGQVNFWHPDMWWYGPCGIGTTQGLKGFEDYHQIPFLHAFPDRKGGHHKARFGEGAYAASTGWPSLWATHRGDYLGVPATGNKVGMRVMDWWRREGDRLVENWVFIDMIDLLLQLEVDLFERLHCRVSESFPEN